MQKLSVEQVRLVQLELLKKFDEFCCENNITYYAFAGTLLGTIRHKGFIPWDNDIDVAVSRTDYQRLQNILRDDNAHNYFRFLCFENDSEYCWQHGRISAKHTYMKTARGYRKLGLSIDIFPLDSQGNDKRKALKNLKKIRECVQLRIMAYDKKYKKFKFPNANILTRIKLAIMFFAPGHDNESYWVKRHIQLAQKFGGGADNSFYYGCNSNDKYTVVCERELYKDVIYMDFENTKIPVPSGYDEILKKYYGNYMELPPVHKQKGAKEMEIYLVE